MQGYGSAHERRLVDWHVDDGSQDAEADAAIDSLTNTAMLGWLFEPERGDLDQRMKDMTAIFLGPVLNEELPS